MIHLSLRRGAIDHHLFFISAMVPASHSVSARQGGRSNAGAAAVGSSFHARTQVRSVKVPNLRLVDLPGLVSAHRAGEPADMAERTLVRTESRRRPSPASRCCLLRDACRPSCCFSSARASSSSSSPANQEQHARCCCARACCCCAGRTRSCYEPPLPCVPNDGAEGVARR